MCGIAGIYNFKTQRPVAAQTVQAMCDVMPYRGPDGEGVWTDGPIGLGHRRLSILDVSAHGAQPMASPEGDTVISYNGEVYNYVELADELRRSGQDFQSSCDTEVLLQLYRHQGIAALDRLNGMYGFAVWDKRKQSLLLARDRIGIKPLYYTVTDDGIIFGSEIKVILEALPDRPTVNTKLLDAYMSLGYAPTQDCLFAGIHKLQPGHFLLVENGELTIKPYWDIEFRREDDLGEDHYVEQITELFEDATRIQLRSDVPLGVFLSGGIDSSAVVAMMSKMGVADIKTFSVAWDHGKNFNETEYARKIATQFGCDHHEYFMTAADFQDFLPDYVWHMDEPVTEAAALSLYFIAKRAKEEVTVVLSGEGSDEVFGGYPIYGYMQALEYYRQLPAGIRERAITPLLHKLGGKWPKYATLTGQPLEKRYTGVSFYEEGPKQALYTPQLADHLSQHHITDVIAPFYDRTAGMDAQTRMQYLDVKSWLVDDLLIKADRMSMAASLELRVPFLDHRLMELAATIPSKYRLRKFQTKYLIKKAMEPFLPHDILYRKKMGFPTPLAILFQSELKEYVGDTLTSERFRARGYFQPEVVNSYLDEHMAGDSDHHKILWQLLVLEQWHRRFIDGVSA